MLEIPESAFCAWRLHAPAAPSTARIVAFRVATEAIVAFEQVRKIAEECDDKDLLTVGQLSTYWLTLVGRLGDAFAVVEEMIESTQSDPNLGRATFGFCARAWAEMWRGWVLGHMGRLEESRASFDEASDLARAYDDAETLGWTLCSYAQLAWLSGEPGDSLHRAREGALIAEGSGSSISLCLANLTLAFAYLARGEWDEAQAAAERALEMVRGAHTGLQYESLILSMIAEAKLATGDYAGGLEAAEQGVASAQDSKTRLHELEARLSLARAVLASGGAAARVRIAQLLDETMALALECGAGSHVPRVHIELAELSHLEGDEEGYERELREAQRLFEEIGARGRAATVASQLAALPA